MNGGLVAGCNKEEWARSVTRTTCARISKNAFASCIECRRFNDGFLKVCRRTPGSELSCATEKEECATEKEEN